MDWTKLFDFSDYDKLIPLVTNSLIAGALLALVAGRTGPLAAQIAALAQAAPSAGVAGCTASRDRGSARGRICRLGAPVTNLPANLWVTPVTSQ